jgi:predicted metal-dependent hydrolase
MHNDETAARLAEGVALFNAGHFYEAHEVWEEAWRREQGVRRQLLQGLILVAAGWVKREAGNARGTRVLFTRALERLEGLPPVCEGVDVERLRPQVARWREGEAAERPVLVVSGASGGSA